MIPKSKAIEAQQKTYENQANELGKRVDAAIERNTDGSVYVDIGCVARPAVEAVATKYRAGGWTVSITDSQRDGATMTLS